jgi:hypothetical protein
LQQTWAQVLVLVVLVVLLVVCVVGLVVHRTVTRAAAGRVRVTAAVLWHRWSN